MEVGSAGAGAVSQITPTQTGSVQQVSRAEQQAELESPPPAQESAPPPQPDQRVGTVVDVSV